MGCAGSAPLPNSSDPTPSELAKRPWRKLNVVCLHGVTMNAEALRNWEAMHSLEKHCETIATFHYITAPHKFVANAWSIANGIPVSDASTTWFTESPPDYGWWTSKALVTEYLVNRLGGPIDVLIGYSQGGLMLANILQHAADAEPFRSMCAAVFLHSPDFLINPPWHKLGASVKTVGGRGPVATSDAPAVTRSPNAHRSHTYPAYLFRCT